MSPAIASTVHMLVCMDSTHMNQSPATPSLPCATVLVIVSLSSAHHAVHARCCSPDAKAFVHTLPRSSSVARRCANLKWQCPLQAAKLPQGLTTLHLIHHISGAYTDHLPATTRPLQQLYPQLQAHQPPLLLLLHPSAPCNHHPTLAPLATCKSAPHTASTTRLTATPAASQQSSYMVAQAQAAMPTMHASLTSHDTTWSS
jgi:hypothetical protein